MSQAEVTRTGLGGERPGRHAAVGSRGGREPQRRRSRDESVVPPASFGSYYGRPVLHEPTWKPVNIAGYFFLGGLAGASSMLGAGAQASGLPGLARVCKLGAVGALGGSMVGLIADLGRPERFLNMLRVAKPTSPMSVGTWLLAGYGPAAGVAALTDLTGRLPRVGAAATVTAAALGPGVASYTAALIADTAVPAWHEGHQELPFVFVGSALAAAGGLGMVASSVAEAGPARRAAVLGSALEISAARRMVHRLGWLARPYEQGRGGRMLRTAEVLAAVGALGGATLGRRSRTAAVLSGAALLTGSALSRFGVFHAGVESARDPEYTVRPQRERLQERERRTPDPSGVSGATGSPPQR